jgi:hypothetical protein
MSVHVRTARGLFWRYGPVIRNAIVPAFPVSVREIVRSTPFHARWSTALPRSTIRPLAEVLANVPSHATPDHASVTRMITTLSDFWLAACRA